jgi:hypothetical protein
MYCILPLMAVTLEADFATDTVDLQNAAGDEWHGSRNKTSSTAMLIRMPGDAPSGRGQATLVQRSQQRGSQVSLFRAPSRTGGDTVT